MSEVIASAPKFEATEASVNNQEIKDPSWGGELMDFVSANQHVIVRCPWMGGAEVTLGEAMTAYSYPPNMTEKDLPMVASVVYELLANRVLEKEEPAEDEEQPQEDETSQTREKEEPEEKPPKIEKQSPKPNQEPETLADQPKPKPTNLSEPPKNEIEAAKPSEQTLPNDAAATEKAAPASRTQTETARPVATPPKTEIAAKAEAGAESSSSLPETPSVVNSNSPEAVAAAGASPETFTQESASIRPADAPGIEFPSNPDQPKRALEEFAAAFDLPGAAMGEEDLDLNILEEFADLPHEAEIAQEDLEAAVPGSEISEITEEDLLDLAEQDEIFIRHDWESAAWPEEQFDEPLIISATEESALIQLNSEAEHLEQIETGPPELFTQIETQAIQDSLILITERIEASDPETAEMANETMDKISDLVTMLEEQGREDTALQDEVMEELEELFVELFEQLDIDYTPELIQSLAQLTLNQHSSHLIKNNYREEGDNDLPQEEGTHEIIKNMLGSLSDVKTAMASVIGKSAIRLYTYDFPTELRKRLAV